MPGCVHETLLPAAPARVPRPAGGCLHAWPTLPSAAATSRPGPACLAAYTNTGPHFPTLPAGSRPAQRSPLWGRVSEGRRSSSTGEPEKRTEPWRSTNGSAVRIRTRLRRHRTTRAQTAVYTGRPDGLYAGVHEDTAAGVTATTYAWVQARLRAGTPANAYA